MAAIISKRGTLAILEATPTIDTGAYASGDLLGPKIDLADAVAAAGDGGIIETVEITDLDKQSVNIDVLFFDADPSNTTFTDNDPMDPDDADLLNLIGVAHITDWTDFNDNSVGQAANLNRPFVLAAGTSLFACMVARGAPTYGATGLTLRVGIVKE